MSMLFRTVDFLFCSAVIYACYISSGLYHEKILKVKYVNLTDNTSSTFSDPIIFTFFPPLVAAVIGLFLTKYDELVHHTSSSTIPFRNVAFCSMVISINMLTYNYAVINASFPAVVMVKSCSLLSVILVALFCSRVKEISLKLSKRKIWIGLLVSVGILMFNFFKVSEDDQSTDKPISILSSILLLISLCGDGLLADLQAQIKSEFKPSSMEMYYNINRCVAMIALGYMLLTGRLVPIYSFLQYYDGFRQDVAVFSVLNAVGQLAIYRMVKQFKQHIPSFVIATRKCFTVLINIVYFHHQIGTLQSVGLLCVFTAVLAEVYENYTEKQAIEGSAESNKFNPIAAEDVSKENIESLQSELTEQSPSKPLNSDSQTEE